MFFCPAATIRKPLWFLTLSKSAIDDFVAKSYMTAVVAGMPQNATGCGLYTS